MRSANAYYRAPIRLFLHAARLFQLVGCEKYICDLVATRATAEAKRDNGLPVAVDLLQELNRRLQHKQTSPQLSVRHLLAFYLLQSKRYLESVEEFRRLLTWPTDKHAEADIRRRMADALEGLGAFDEADQERAAALICAVAQPASVTSLLTQASQMKAAGQYADALGAYEMALNTIYPKGSELHITIYASLAIAAYALGRLEEVLRWALEGIAADPAQRYSLSLHTMASAGYRDRGDWGRAEHHVMQKHDQALAQGRTAQAVRALGSLAGLKREQGKIDEAFEIAERAERMGCGDIRVARLVKANCYLNRGQFAEALRGFEAASASPASWKPSVERRMQAIISTAEATVYLMLDCPVDADAHLQIAAAGMGSHPKLGVWVRATCVWRDAVAGDLIGARRQLDEFEEALTQLRGDRQTLTRVTSCLGRVAMRIEDWDQSERLWQYFLATTITPVEAVTGEYFLAETLIQLDRSEESRIAYERAAAFGIDTYYARLAREKLQTLDL
ncbi:hypothetical protein [Capsulimonas corticalis]|uniref:hypothetical protein n=1 Tax=Capsulimonas corticalis TaxID=2219043 RepID=UPI000F654E22|nr:hypothetical protein [Capsulimonas corticalis]